MNHPLRVLLIDDNPDERTVVIRKPRWEFPNMHVEHIIDTKGFARALEADEFDPDYQVRWSNGLAVLQAVKSRCSDPPLIMFTGTESE